MAIAEWQLKSPATLVRDSRWGIAQVGLPFIGAIFAMIGALLDFFPLLALNVPLEVIGVIIFLVRLSPELRRQNWLAGTSGRMFSLSAIFVAVNIGLLSYLIITYAEDFELTPPWLIFAMDHAIFIGMMTNGLFGLVYEASHEQRSFLSWVDHLLFWGMNIGMVGFVVGLIRQSADIKRIFTPIMGVSILVAIVTYTIRLYLPIRKQWHDQISVP
jgi:predicted membrane protein